MKEYRVHFEKTIINVKARSRREALSIARDNGIDAGWVKRIEVVKSGPSIADINTALDKLKAEFDAAGMPMTVNHLKEKQ